MWKFSQSSGLLSRGEESFVGYSGAGEHKNRHDSQHIPNEGPIPCGLWTIEGPPYDTPEHGPYVMRLIPGPTAETFKRAGFLIHGTNKDGTASKGCICVSPRASREAIWNSEDRVLHVVE